MRPTAKGRFLRKWGRKCVAHLGLVTPRLFVCLIERGWPQLKNRSAGRQYRKVCLPRGEIEKGCASGRDYPVFETRFGKVGMMEQQSTCFPRSEAYKKIG